MTLVPYPCDCGGTTEGPLSFIQVFSKATDAIQQFPHQSRLAHPRIADHRHQAGTTVGDDRFPRALQNREFVVAADDRRVLAPHIAILPMRRDQAVGGHRLRLALQGQRLDGFDFDGVAHEPVRHVADLNFIRRSGLLEPRRHVNGVSGRKLLIGIRIVDSDNLAGIHAGPVREHDTEA